MSKRAVVLLSGGLDSAVCATIAAQEVGNQNVLPICIAYGQKHATEIGAAKNVAKDLKLLPLQVLDLSDVFSDTSLGMSKAHCSLIDPLLDVPETTYEEVRKTEGVSPMYVPFRNGLFISIAAAVALQVGADFIYYGAHNEDGHNWAYPDCTPEFNGAMMNAIYIGTYHELRLLTPLQWMNKTEVVAAALTLGTPIASTYSCYVGREKHCGICATCVSRINAFKVHGVEDPVEYETDVDWGPTVFNLNK